MLIERPRPSYMLNLFFFVLALAGMCIYAIVDHWIGIKRFSLVMPVAAVALILLVPSYFTPEYRNPDTSNTRPLLLRYERLVPFQALLTQPGTHLLAFGWPSDLCSYIAVRGCTPLDYRTFLEAKPADVPFADWLTQQNITLFYVDEYVFADPSAQTFLENPASAGWDIVTWTQTDDSHWELLKRHT